jgi:hypothetical protein
LAGHGDAYPFLSGDEVIVVLCGGVDVDLDPVDGAVEVVAPGAVVGDDERAGQTRSLGL